MRRSLLSSVVTFAVAAALPCGACNTTFEPGRTTIATVEADASGAHDSAAVDVTPPEDASVADVVTPPEATPDGGASTSDASEAGTDGPASDGPAEAGVDAAPATCHDNLKDGDETDIDCGGGQCGGCGPNKGCASTSDCSSTASGCGPNVGGCACDLVTGTCVYDHCFDQRKDGNETDVDCGGGECPPCGPMQGCGLDGDCTTNACDGIASVCVASQCNDHRRDGDETDVDCGGSDSCGRCTVGERCVVKSDCLPGHTCSATPSTCM